jgi:lysophospholipase L1-like esterase
VLVGLLVVPAVLGLTGLVALGPARSHPHEPSSAVLALPPPEAAPRPVHRVVALGDSVATGTACGCDDYVALLARTLDYRQDTSVISTNLAVGGATSADVLTQLSGAQTRSALSRADLVVVRGSDGSEDCTPLLAPDGDHASAQGHALIARTIAAALA